jgi:crotonobetaine/carnitine-CoA ligase
MNIPAPLRAELPAIHPYLGRDVPWLLETQAQRHGDRTFLTWVPFEGDGETWSYRELADRAARFAAGLTARGVRPGDRVIVHMGNRPEFLAAFFGCSWAGAVAVTTNIHSGRGELKYFAENAEARVAITEAALAGDLMSCGAAFDWVACADKVPEGAIAYGALCGEEPMPRRAADPSLYHSVMYTSGTTSRPKAVVFTHANVLWAAERNAIHETIDEEDVALVYLPLFHLNALGYSTFATLWSGGRIVLQPKFSASRLWDTAAAHGCTWAAIGPFVTKALLELPQPKSHGFRFWGNNWGADPVVMANWGIPSLGWYGMTETVSHPIISDIKKPPPDYAVGRAAAEYALRLVDETGMDIAPGQAGRLLVKGVRGVSLFYEYLNNPQANAEAFDADGWFDTGDMIDLLPDGSMRFADRKKDMLKVGGENVAASEVEAVIQEVAGVEEVAVIGRPHPFLHETPLAFVVARGADEALTARIEAACAEALATFKRPREVIYIDALPRLPIGKLDRKALRDRIAAEASPPPRPGDRR